MLERDEALSEQEKREAKALYESEKNMSMSRFVDEPFNPYKSDMQNRLGIGGFGRPVPGRPMDSSWPFPAPPPMP